MGPKRAAEIFHAKYKDAPRFHVTLYGSLAATGKGHLTDRVITDTLKPAETTFSWLPDEILPFHPNGMKFEAYNASGYKLDEWVAYSVGGGKIVSGSQVKETEKLYPQKTMNLILATVEKDGETFWEYVFRVEKEGFEEYLAKIWGTMKECIKRGLAKEGVLPGSLHLPRKAASFFMKAKNSSIQQRPTNKLFSYALAVAEENAAGGIVVTAPTCGSAGRRIAPRISATRNSSTRNVPEANWRL